MNPLNQRQGNFREDGTAIPFNFEDLPEDEQRRRQEEAAELTAFCEAMADAAENNQT
ncbi:hypothetical protein ABZX40_17935 [Streptomyces sp. NPDC004610]|uniref:hypothetical protein n=1 Tax=unclassified Streptomyces TaxID=2593676 RepID=UPI0033B912C9